MLSLPRNAQSRIRGECHIDGIRQRKIACLCPRLYRKQAGGK